MQIVKVKSQAAGNMYRDAELISLKYGVGGLEIIVLKDSDKSKWRIRFEGIVAFRVVSEEFMMFSGVTFAQLPSRWNFFEILESPWIASYKCSQDTIGNTILNNRRHLIYCCYDEVIEVITKDFKIEKISRE